MRRESFGPIADRAHSALGVEQRNLLDARIVDAIGRARAILEAGHGNPFRNEVIRRIDDVCLPVAGAITAARADDKRHAGPFPVWRKVGAERRQRDHPDPGVRVHSLRRGVLHKLRWLAGPKRDWFRRSCAEQLAQGQLAPQGGSRGGGRGGGGGLRSLLCSQCPATGAKRQADGDESVHEWSPHVRRQQSMHTARHVSCIEETDAPQGETRGRSSRSPRSSFSTLAVVSDSPRRGKIFSTLWRCASASRSVMASMTSTTL
jgi:hypothetical protein